MNADEDAARGEFIRDALAIQMWRDYYVMNLGR